MRQADVYVHDQLAGVLTEDESGYRFVYSSAYLQIPEPEAVSLTLPLSAQEYHSKVLFPFFDGLIPEGWLLEIAQKTWKIDRRDRMSLLMAVCRDCIGAVSIIAEPKGSVDE
ncbi:MAG: HipA N-terminal domain-containing protein [Candidatus Riflebacteria bacterium]|nr:HipA N-terminal domain-containing protein [Candidatus Riflebacteria bacterium]